MKCYEVSMLIESTRQSQIIGLDVDTRTLLGVYRKHYSMVEARSVNVCMYVCMVITYSRVRINRVRLPILLVVS